MVDDSNSSVLQPKNVILRTLIASAFLCLFAFLVWEIEASLTHPFWIALLIILSTCYFVLQIATNWVLYWYAKPNIKSACVNSHSIDVYLTAYNEDHELIENAIIASKAMALNHETWLLDDSSSPALELMANNHNIGYLSRTDRLNAKSGNLNFGLANTSGELIAIFDIDHIPNRDFLSRSVGHFTDPKVGFVQVMLTFSNEDASWIARAASESSLDFYNATSLGMDAICGTTMMGSNSIIRRKALESIGGYKPGLAEDLATSLALHAADWKSKYVAEPLAPGLAPPDLTAWFTQQLKWARGVFEVLLTDMLRLFTKLTPSERLCYLVRTTKYWVGPFVAGHLLITCVLLWFEPSVETSIFNQYIMMIVPFVTLDFMIRTVAMSLWSLDEVKSKSLHRAVMLIYSTFPIYTLAWFMALLRIPLRFRPTPKRQSGKLSTKWRIPIIAAMVIFDLGIVHAIRVGVAVHYPFFMSFAVLATAPIMAMFYHSLRIGKTN